MIELLLSLHPLKREETTFNFKVMRFNTVFYQTKL